MNNICFGIDVGGTSVKLGAFSTDGTLLDKWEIPTRQENNSKSVIPDIAASVKKYMDDHGYTFDNVIGAGMGVPGPVQPDGYVELVPNIKGWSDMYPARELSKLLDNMNVCVANDGNIAALGESFKGGAAGFDDAVMITLGTGVGSGIIIDGHIVTGRHGLGGEIGHIHVRDGEKERCNCGGMGCLEQVASATGIVREAKRMLSRGSAQSTMRSFGDKLTAKDVLDCAKAGDEMAKLVMEIVGKYLGIAVSHVALTVDPDVFVIGGGVSKAGTYLVDLINKYYDYYTPISKNRGKVVLATLGNDAGIYGGAKLVL